VHRAVGFDAREATGIQLGKMHLCHHEAQRNGRSNPSTSGAKMIFGHLALISASAFAGAAIYINVAEHPARLLLDDQALLSEWKPSYKRGILMQAPLAVVGCILGMIAWWNGRELSFLVGAVLMIANWPWTLLGIMPTNNALMAISTANTTAQTRSLIVKWGNLHAVRSALGLLATIAFLLGCILN
jgi:hypothetical protein